MITLQPGDMAPDFTAKDTEGNTITLKDFKGRKLAIYFYPQDDTPACTTQACNLRDNFSILKKEGIEIIGISPDDAQSHKSFTEKYSLPFTLIPDPEHKIIGKYGVWGMKNLYGKVYEGLLRTTFLIDEDGKIKHIFKKPKTRAHAEEIIQKFR